jgi:Protein of unknown function (DUF2924)
VVELRGLELRARHAVLSKGSLWISQGNSREEKTPSNLVSACSFSPGLPAQQERACTERDNFRIPAFGPVAFRAWGSGGPETEVQLEPAESHRNDQSKANENTLSASRSELSHGIAALTDLSAQQLRDEWRRLYRDKPPRMSRDLLVRAIAYRMQELAFGGISKATHRKLMALTKELAATGSVVCDRDREIRPGTRLVREWRGRTHKVVVTNDGFEYVGKTYASLSKIAQAITGAHWSGPRFFGLNRRDPTSPPSDTDPDIVYDGEVASDD